jgi:hypothetical protein
MIQLEFRRHLIERDFRLKRLQHAVKKVKILNGLLPICANCKVIRNEKWEWVAMETYIRDRSQAEFTRGICPACKQDLDSQKKDWA